MEQKNILEALNKLKEKKRNFTQSVDIIVNLDKIDIKKQDQKVDFFHILSNGIGKEKKVCALVDQELVEDAKKYCDFVIHQKEFDSYKDQIKKLANEYDFFIAQANIMTKVAAAFGTILGPKGKMPNPKAGCVVPPKADLKSLVNDLRKKVRLQVKNDPVIRCIIGRENLGDEKLAQNVLEIYNSLLEKLPKGKENVKNVMIKLTMTKPIKLEL